MGIKSAGKRRLRLDRSGRIPDYTAQLRGCLDAVLHVYGDQVANTVSVTVIQREQFVWQAGGELGADITITPGDDDEAFLDAMAEFLWTQRHQLNPTEKTP